MPQTGYSLSVTMFTERPACPEGIFSPHNKISFVLFLRVRAGEMASAWLCWGLNTVFAFSHDEVITMFSWRDIFMATFTGLREVPCMSWKCIHVCLRGGVGLLFFWGAYILTDSVSSYSGGVPCLMSGLGAVNFWGGKEDKTVHVWHTTHGPS